MSTGGSSPPSCNINEYLMSIGDQLSLSAGVIVELWVPWPLCVRPGQSFCRLLALHQDLSAQYSVPEWYRSIPVLIHWVRFVRGFACMFACMHVHMCVCLYVCLRTML